MRFTSIASISLWFTYGDAATRRLRCNTVIFPDVGAALSASGAMMSELTTEFSRTAFMKTTAFDRVRAKSIIEELVERAQDFFAKATDGARDHRIDLSIEGRYPSQVWEIEVPLRSGDFSGEGKIEEFIADFHARHTELFSFRDDGDDIEIMSWRALVRCRLSDENSIRLGLASVGRGISHREMFFRETGLIQAPAYRLEHIDEEMEIAGPAIVDSNFTTVIVNPGALARKSADGHLVVNCAA